MYIFSKWPFCFSSLVLLKIITAITKCIFSVVINVCNGMECILKSEENPALAQNVLPRMKTNLIKNRGLNHSRSSASYSVNRNIKPASVHFLIPNLPSGKKITVRHINRHRVVANFSDVTYDDLSNFQHKAMTVERTRPQVCLKLDNTFSDKVLETFTPLDQGSKTSQSRKLENRNGIKIFSEHKRSVKNTEQVLINKICNASGGSSCLKLNTSDKVHKLKLNEPNSSENDFSESVSLNIPQQIVEHRREFLSADLRHKNVHQGNKIIQNSEKKYSKDYECHSDLVTAVHNVSQFDDNESGNESFRDDECHSEFVAALQKVFKWRNNDSENQLVESEKNGYIKGSDSQDVKQVGDTKEEVTVSVPKGDGNLKPSLHLFVKSTFCPDGTLLPSDKTTPEKCGAHCPEKPIMDAELIKILDQQTMLTQMVDSVIDSATYLSKDIRVYRNNPPSKEETLNILKIGNPGYIDFLRETNPLIQEIETELLNLCKVHYCKSSISGDDLKVLSKKLANLLNKSRDVNSIPHYDFVYRYVEHIVEVVNLIPIRTDDSISNSKAVKRSFYLKQVTRTLAEKRNLLFHVSEETKAVQKQIQKIGKVPPKKIKKHKRQK